MPLRCFALLAGGWICASAAEGWQLQYFYDEDRSSLTLNDLAFPSARRGIAIGYITEKQKSRPTALITNDGGAHWSLAPLKEQPVSLFCLNDTLWWMVTSKGIWKTEEAGKSWNKVKTLPNMLRAYFLDENHGWIVGAHKAVYETKDGGRTWERVAAADQPKANPEFTHYGWIEFADKQAGLISGWSRPPRPTDSAVPDWIEPEKASKRREWPALTIMLDTRDGGKTWVPSASSLFGRITRVRLAPDGEGLGLIQFFDQFELPSEVFRLNWKTGKSSSVFRRKDRAITDILLLKSGAAYLAGTEPVGRLRQSPIPGKLKILRTTDFKAWTEMETDYRATAHQAMLAASDESNIWAATDTGMILKLTAQP